MSKYIFTLLFAFIPIIVSCNKGKTIHKKSTPENTLKLIQSTYGINNFYNSNATFNIDNELYYTLKRQNNRSYFAISRKTDNKSYKGTYADGHIEYYINDTLQDNATYNRLFLDVKLDAFAHTAGIPSTLNTNDLIIKEYSPVDIRKRTYNVLYITTKAIPDIPVDEYYLYYDPDTYLIHYIALNHKLTNPYRSVFRKLVNHREINSIIFADYYSFVAKDDNTPLEILYKEFNAVNLDQVGTVIYQDIEVQLFE